MSPSRIMALPAGGPAAWPHGELEPKSQMYPDPRPNEDDEEIARVREARHRISERFGHDPDRLVAYYMERQKGHPERLVRAPEPDAGCKTHPAGK